LKNSSVVREFRDGIGINREKRENSLLSERLSDFDKGEDTVSMSSKVSIAVKSQYSFTPSVTPSQSPSAVSGVFFNKDKMYQRHLAQQLASLPAPKGNFKANF
jgi:hypothetical protein